MPMRVRSAAFLFILASCVLSAAGEQLPVKTYTIADGLARDSVEDIRQDSHGFLWFCTAEGISRFDGYTFRNYGIAEGLPHRVVDAFVETRDGDHLFGTDNGLVEFNPDGPDKNGSYFTAIDLGGDHTVIALASGPDGTIWAGTTTGLFHLTKRDGLWLSELVDLHLEAGISSLMADPDGTVWGTDQYGLFRKLPYGIIIVISQCREPVGCYCFIWMAVAQRFCRSLFMRPGRRDRFVTLAFKISSPFVPATMVNKGAGNKYDCF